MNEDNKEIEEKIPMKEKIQNFKLILNYLKEDKLKMFIYIIVNALEFLPPLLIPYVWGLALEALILKDNYGFYKYMIFYTLIYVIFYSILMLIEKKLYNSLEIKFIKNVSKDLYKKIDELPARAFEEMGVGQYTSRLSNDPDTVMSLINRLITMTCKLIVVIFVVAICIKASWVLGLEILIFAAIMAFISRAFFPKIETTQEKIKKEYDNYIKVATENISGIREIKSLGIKEKTEKTIFKILDRLYGNSLKLRKNEDNYYCSNNFVYFILQSIILVTGGYLFIQGKLSYSLFIMIESYICRLDEVVESISDFGVNFNKVSVSLKRMDEILNNKLYKSEKFGLEEIENPKGIIEFKDVTFRYAKEEDDTLTNLNMRIVPHKKIAIVGRSGNGKSTIFNLLLRYFDTTTGEILVDDINIQDLTEKSLRNTISIIRQNPFLFNMSILENFKILNEDITLEQVREACKKAYIDDYIMNLPKKYDTIIGEGGVNLSGGQKQRIAIARTLLLNTKIILFDEATSALDNESQEYIKKTIDNLVKDHTVVIVAHRLSTIVDADIINIIDKGHLVGTGTHEELLKSNKIYQKLYSKEN